MNSSEGEKTGVDTGNDRRYTQVADDFISDDLRQMRLAPRYNDWLFRLIVPFLGRRIVEIGCGIGTFTKRLLDTADGVMGIEPNAACRADLLAQVGTHPRFQLEPTPIETCDEETLRAHAFDTAVLINVLEHIPDDTEALRHCARILQPGGRVVLIVPAVPMAYGPIDRAVGHFRRYSRTDLGERLRRAGFIPEYLRYSNLVGLLGWMYNSRGKGIVRQSDRQIRWFNRLTPLLAAAERVIPPPLGMSLVGVGRVNQEPAHVQ